MRSPGYHQFFGNRLRLAAGIICFVFFLLGLRLSFLQVFNGSHFRNLSENNRTRTIRTLAPRGNIYDRNGKLLVQNRPLFNVSLLLEDVRDVDSTLTQLSKISGRDKERLKNALSDQRRQHFEPRVVMADVSRKELARVSVRNHSLPGVIVEVNPTRMYPYNTFASHILGYARELTRDQLDSEYARKKGLKAQDMIGKSGVEKQWEEQLQGSAGYREVEVDAKGKRRGELGIVDDVPGNDVHLTIDFDVQAAAEKALYGKRGAVVALDPRSGEVLALASAPSFDGNIFSGKMTAKEWHKLLNDPTKPLKNRAISAYYAPGSTFKFITAIAGLMEKKISGATSVHCPGYYFFGKRKYHCHKRSGHGKVNLEKSLRVSCDTYYYELGRKLGIDKISKYASLFGLGKRTGIDLGGEKPGINPSSEWKKKAKGEVWFPGETLSASIGQGYVTSTPMQIANAIAAIANGGTVFKPRLLKEISNSEQGVVLASHAEATKIDIPPTILKAIQRAAEQVVVAKDGTGKAAALDAVRVGGKTGTSQVVSLGKGGDKERFKDHAWFVSFAPVDDPQIAISVVVENGGNGGETAAPVSKMVMEAFFKKYPPQVTSTKI